MKHFIRVPLNPDCTVYDVHSTVYAAAAGTERPLWRKFGTSALVLADHPHPTLESEPYQPAIKQGGLVYIDLVANASIDHTQPGSRRRVDPVMEVWYAGGQARPLAEVAREVGEAWLAKRAEANGFRIVDLDTVDYATLRFQRKGQSIRLGTLHYRGQLQVFDAVKFHDLLLSGIGHSKAWGLGLVLCHPLSPSL